MSRIERSACLLGLLMLVAQPLSARRVETVVASGYTEAGRQVAFTVASAPITTEAIARAADAKVSGLVAMIAQLNQGITDAQADRAEVRRQRDELARRQEELVAELSRRDTAYARAVAAFREQVSDVAKDPERLQALALYNQGQKQKALAVLRELADADEKARQIASKVRNAADLRSIAALTVAATGNDGITTEQAIAAYEAVVAIDATAWDWHSLATLYQQAGALPKAERAAKAMLAAAESERDQSSALNQLGAVQQAQGDLAAALASYRRGLEIAERLAAADPSSAEGQRDLWVSHFKLGQVAIAQGDEAAAAEHLRAVYDILVAMDRRGMHLSPADRQWLDRLHALFGSP